MNADLKGAAQNMHFAYRELLTPRMALVAGGIVVFFLVQYTSLGPSGTGETMNWIERLGFWAMVGALQFPISYASGVLTLYIVRRRRHVEIWAALIFMVLILSASCTAIIVTTYGLFIAGRMPDISLPRLYGLCTLNLFCATAFMYYVLCTRIFRQGAADRSGAPSAPADPGSRTAALPPDADGGEASAPAPADAPAGQAAAEAGIGRQDDPAAASRFFDRLPDEIGRDIIYLSAAAHYVDVITSAGSASILLRFADAVSELGDLGIRVHRSYWVAYRHVKQAFRRDGRTMLRLTGDHEVRVGRNFLPEVRAAAPKAWIRARRREVHNPDTSA